MDRKQDQEKNGNIKNKVLSIRDQKTEVKLF